VSTGPLSRDSRFWSDWSSRKERTAGATKNKQKNFVVAGANRSLARTLNN